MVQNARLRKLNRTLWFVRLTCASTQRRSRVQLALPAEAGEYDAEDINEGRALMPGATQFQPKPMMSNFEEHATRVVEILSSIALEARFAEHEALLEGYVCAKAMMCS